MNCIVWINPAITAIKGMCLCCKTAFPIDNLRMRMIIYNRIHSVEVISCFLINRRVSDKTVHAITLFNPYQDTYLCVSPFTACFYVVFRYVYHMGIDSIISVKCELVVDLPENFLANRPFLTVATSFKNCSQSLEL